MTTALRPTDLQPVLLGAASLMGTDMGSLQLFDASANVLRILCYTGFAERFFHHFETVPAGYCPCGMSIKRLKRVVIEDVFKDPTFSYLGPIFSSYGYRAVQSTPFFDGAGNPAGVISNHFSGPRALKAVELGYLDTYLSKKLAPLGLTVQPQAAA